LTGNAVLRTKRLRLRPPDTADADFILRLLNDESFLRFIGDRGVRTPAGACAWIETSLEHHRLHGFGLWLVERTQDREPLGICGVMQKPWLPYPDLAYAFAPPVRGSGYALEAARAVVNLTGGSLAIPQLVAVVVAENATSIRLLEKLSFTRDGSVTDPEGVPLELYAVAPGGAAPQS
jgi:RimJ/RimL family protein N-acetyltransferase